MDRELDLSGRRQVTAVHFHCQRRFHPPPSSSLSCFLVSSSRFPIFVGAPKNVHHQNENVLVALPVEFYKMLQ
jgi:hypothetical protein